MLDVRACALPPTKSVGASLNRPHIDCLFPVIATEIHAVFGADKVLAKDKHSDSHPGHCTSSS